MKRTNIPEPDLEKILKHALRDDLPPETEARMNSNFLNLKRRLDHPDNAANPNTGWLWARWAFRKEILVFASALMLILGSVIHLGGQQSALANSITRLKTLMDVSATLNSTSSMDCTVVKSGTGGKNSNYRIRWNASGITRVDRKSTDGVRQTLWISNTVVPPDRVWQPAMEFLTPTILAQHLEGPYGLMQVGQRDAAGPDEFLLVGRENQQVIEIAVDQRTYLPKTLRRYMPDSRTGEARNCALEVRFLWNRPVPEELLIPRPAAGKR